MDPKEILDQIQISNQQELFMFTEHSPGSPIFLPNGVIIYNKLMDFLKKEYFKRGFTEVRTPQMFKSALWEKSGHWDKYKENMFQLTDGEEDIIENKQHIYALKPMQCPIHCLIFESKPRSYKDLPLRYADFGTLHRNEFSGSLSKLLRVRTFSQDDAHIFCAQSQIESEIKSCLSFLDFVYSKFGFEFELELSTRPQNFIGETSLWDLAEKQLADALENYGKKWTVSKGEGAFYGPKIDVHIKDALGRKHQCATVQLDFQLPIRFDLQYRDDKNQFQKPVIVHRAIYGSFERFMGILCEHYQGKWPLWLSPRQIKVVPVSEKFINYAQKITDTLRDNYYHADLDTSNNTVSKKIIEAELDKYNYILVVGQKEQDANTVNIRYRDKPEKKLLSEKELLDELRKNVDNFM